MVTSEQQRTRDGGYVDAGGVRTYYEVAGEGEPLILLHGGMCTAETLGAQTPALAEHFHVYVPERRGHGRTPDVEGPITYEIMATDTIAFMEAVGIASADLVGFSDVRGGVARRPRALRRGVRQARRPVARRPGHRVDELERVPTLVLLGDRDIVSLDHAAAMQRALPAAQVGVVPGATHALPMEKPELTNRLVLDFLAEEIRAAPLPPAGR
jgi:pimeloyl-ACP methyl ester carboxylesterase